MFIHLTLILAPHLPRKSDQGPNFPFYRWENLRLKTVIHLERANCIADVDDMRIKRLCI